MEPTETIYSRPEIVNQVRKALHMLASNPEVLDEMQVEWARQALAAMPPNADPGAKAASAILAGWEFAALLKAVGLSDEDLVGLFPAFQWRGEMDLLDERVNPEHSALLWQRLERARPLVSRLIGHPGVNSTRTWAIAPDANTVAREAAPQKVN